jgi:hypothetical protein
MSGSVPPLPQHTFIVWGSAKADFLVTDENQNSILMFCISLVLFIIKLYLLQFSLSVCVCVCVCVCLNVLTHGVKPKTAICVLLGCARKPDSFLNEITF